MTLLREVVSFLTDPETYSGRFALQTLLFQHLWYTVASTALAAAVAVPLGLWIGHRRRGDLAVVAVASVSRAVPDFGIILLAFLVFGLSAINVIIALVALAIPPILVNTFVGVRQVDPDARDAAFGAGMTDWQVLWQVEGPLAVPLILTGLRTSAVQVVATATLGAYTGLGGLGRLIFDGFAAGATRGDPPPGLARVVVGSVLVALFAVVTELLLARAERALTPHGLRAARPRVREDERVDGEVLTARPSA